MTIKIVKGLIANNSPYSEIKVSNNKPVSVDSSKAASSSLQVPNALSQGRALTEAVISSVSINKSALGSTEKIREIKEAKKVSDQVAEKIRDGDEPIEGAHNKLGSKQGRDHLIN
jgi:hypothetical protein